MRHLQDKGDQTHGINNGKNSNDIKLANKSEVQEEMGWAQGHPAS